MRNRIMRIDVTNKQIKGLKLGQTVTIVTKGEITELEAEREYNSFELGSGKKSKKKDKYPPNIQIEVDSTKIDGENAFTELAED